MREILFRGKRKDNGEWVDGDLLHDHFSNVAGVVKYINVMIPFEIDPETIGEYTDLVDKNDVKIFEGDICQNGERTYLICWISWQYAWGCLNLKTGRKTPIYQVISREGNNFEVIGNKFDNPELMGGESNET